jgi:hypothetical protein
MAWHLVRFEASLTVFAVALAACAAEPAAQDQQKSGFMRLVRDPSGKITALETAIVRCVPRDCGKTGPTVDLVAAVHIADRGYYELLNREFAPHDVVLYELVAPEGTKIPEGGKSENQHPVAMIQNMMKDVLELDFQLNRVNYTKPNMVRADMTPKQLSESMERKGESLLTMLIRAMGYSLAKQDSTASDTAELDLLMALFDSHRALALKRLAAEQLEDLEGLTAALGGSGGSSLIEERNKTALAVLRKQIALGKQKIAIFYGAGHMKDMQQRLRDDFDLVPINTRWLVAWNMADAVKKPVAKPQTLKEMFSNP